MRNSKGQFVKGTMGKDITGEKFGMLTAIEFSHTKVSDSGKNRRTYWVFQCECGNIKVLRVDQVKSGNTKSCGCLKQITDRENIKKAQKSNLKYNKDNPLSKTNEYSRWRGMIKRCYNKNDSHYHNYGGRGIKVCDEWLYDFNAFYLWCQESGYSKELQLDRIDNNGNYEPNNCRWVTAKNNSNNRSSNIHITINGVTKTVTEWCNYLNYDTKKAYYLHNKRNIPYEDIFSVLYAHTELNNQIA